MKSAIDANGSIQGLLKNIQNTCVPIAVTNKLV